MVDTSVSTADLPPSGFGITLVPGATEGDAVQVAECLQDALTSGEITIIRPNSS